MKIVFINPAKASKEKSKNPLQKPTKVNGCGVCHFSKQRA